MNWATQEHVLCYHLFITTLRSWNLQLLLIKKKNKTKQKQQLLNIVLENNLIRYINTYISYIWRGKVWFYSLKNVALKFLKGLTNHYNHSFQMTCDLQVTIIEFNLNSVHGGTWIFFFFFFLVGASRGQNPILRGQNPKICLKLADFGHFFWLGATGGRASDWGANAPMRPLDAATALT